MTDIDITVRLFGAFRKHGENIRFRIPAGATAALVKDTLSGLLGADGGLVVDSVLANDNEIIDDARVLTEDSHLAILPPVCGG